MTLKKATVLVNLAELDPPRNGGLSRVAHLVSNLLVDDSTAGQIDVYFAVGWRFAASFHGWAGRSDLQVIPVLPSQGFSPLFDYIQPSLIVSPLLGQFPFGGEKNPYRDVPHLVSMPDALALDRPDLFSPAEAAERRQRYEDLHQASMVVTLSQYARERLQQHLGLHSDQVAVIPLAGDIYGGQLPPLVPDVLPPYVFYPANGWPHKRHDLLFQALQLVWKSRPDLRLVLTGWFPAGRLEYLMQQYEAAPERVIYLDRVSDAQMVTLYKNAEALLFTSAHEGFGMPVLEAMQAGCPVICAPLTSVPEVAGDAALYVEEDTDPQAWAEALLTRLPEKREGLIAQGRKQAERFSWEKVKSNWRHLIQRYLEMSKSGTPVENFVPSQPNLILRELQWWAGQYDHLWEQIVEKEEVIGEQKAVMNKQQGMLDEQKAANDDLHRHLMEKEQVVQAFQSSFRFWLANSPLTRFRLFRWIVSKIKSIQRLLFPRLISPKDQYPPRPIFIPPYYQTTKTDPRHALPSISIVTPSFNQANFLQQTIESVLTQKYPNLQYVVQDGGSQDKTIEILEHYRPHLTHAESRKDGGQAQAINLGFAHTSGEIMAYLNSDDLLLPGALHYVANFFNSHPDVDVIYGHRVIINGDGKEIGRWVLPPHDNQTQLWLDFVPQETMFWRRRIWEKVGSCIDESFQFALDWELFLRFVKAGARVRRVPRFLGAFRSHPEQKTSALIESLGLQEMNRVREKFLGRAVTQTEIVRAIKPYLRLSLVYEALYRLGVLRY